MGGPVEASSTLGACPTILTTGSTTLFFARGGYDGLKFNGGDECPRLPKGRWGTSRSGHSKDTDGRFRISVMRPDHDEVALRAFRIWWEAGGPESLGQEHWDQAERELIAEMQAERRANRRRVFSGQSFQQSSGGREKDANARPP